MNGDGRIWGLILALLTMLAGLAGLLLQHELNMINTRLDRISDYVLEKDKP